MVTEEGRRLPIFKPLIFANGDIKHETRERREKGFLTTDFTDLHGWGQTTKYAKYTNTDPELLTAELASQARHQFDGPSG